jgi:2Fe-2S type ferredoxin
MAEPVRFHSDLYRRDAVRHVVEQYRKRATIGVVDTGADIAVRVETLGPDGDDAHAVSGELCNAALSATVRTLRQAGRDDAHGDEPADDAADPPPWGLLVPFAEGSAIGLGWEIASLGPIRGGAAMLLLRHEGGDTARVGVRRNGGTPVGVAHTEHLDFVLMNGGGGGAPTDVPIAKALCVLADALGRPAHEPAQADLLGRLRPHAEAAAPRARPAGVDGQRRIVPQIDVEARVVAFELDEAGVGRLAIADAVLAFADRCYVLLTRPDPARIGVQLRLRDDASADAVRALARDVTRALNQRVRGGGASGASDARPAAPGPLGAVDLDALLAELEAADPSRLGIDVRPRRGPGHQKFRVLNIRGTGACNSECVFCIEKFNPTHRVMPKADATRDLIASSAGSYDMLFFAAGEPTIHPKLFEYVELAKEVGFSAFGMSSHFRTFADPRFALRTLQAGFRYFDISLHAADATTQLEVNPIGDDGDSLWEALKGLAVLYRIADALDVGINVTHKIVVSRLNATRLEEIFRATYDRGVRHFILQPVRALGLEPALQAKLAIDEEDALPHVNAFLQRTEALDATIKPYGYSRQRLYAGIHVETEQNRVKNVYGKLPPPAEAAPAPAASTPRPADARHWVRVGTASRGSFAFASDGTAPVLDDGLRNGVDLPFGCRMGSCGMCCARLVEGRVDQRDQIFLSEEQVTQGYVLMCQARPLSDVVVQVCSDEEIDRL